MGWWMAGNILVNLYIVLDYDSKYYRVHWLYSVYPHKYGAYTGNIISGVVSQMYGELKNDCPY